MHLPGRFRRGVPAAAGRGLPRPRPLRAHLLQPGAHVGGGHPAARGGDGLVHCGRRLRPGDVRPEHHRAGHGHDLPRRAAAREGRDRRGGHGRGARRRRRARAHLGRRRRARELGRARAGAAARGGRGPRPRGRTVARAARARGARLRHRSARGRHSRGRAHALRRARGDRPDRRRLALRRVQAALRRHARVRLRAHLGLSGRDPRQQRHPLLGVGTQGLALRATGLPAQDPARLPAEHHRLHGREGLRARRHREGRREARHGRRVRAGAEADRRDRRLLRRRQLRHVRPGVRARASCSCGRTRASR